MQTPDQIPASPARSGKCISTVIPTLLSQPLNDMPLVDNILHVVIKEELKSSWEPEFKQARIEAERKKGRELAKRADQNRTMGRVSALCDVACFFIGKDRLDIARHVLEHFMVDREKAVAALESDKRVKSMTLAYLDRSGAWEVF